MENMKLLEIVLILIFLEDSFGEVELEDADNRQVAS